MKKKKRSKAGGGQTGARWWLTERGWEGGILLKQKAAEEEKWGWEGEGGIAGGIRGKMNCVFLHLQTEDDNSEQKLGVPAHCLSLQRCSFRIALPVRVSWCVRRSIYQHHFSFIPIHFLFLTEKQFLTRLSYQQSVFLAAGFSSLRAT